MNNLKFRVPTKCQNGHFRWAYVHFRDDEINEGSLIWGGKNIDCSCRTHAIGEGFTKFDEREMFIGRQDKDGNDIYENDICRTVNTDGEVLYKQIFYSDHFACFFIGNISLKEFIESQWTSSYSLEVVGNTHQNSELLIP